jgi:putative nucleotidyltransferase with HDIG domain
MVETQSPSGLVERKTLQKRALAQIESIPSLSTVVGEFLQLASRDYFTAMDFEKILVKDQALVARLLKVANSSFFGSSREIKTVHEAVVLIGMDNMKNIVYAVSSSGLLRHQMKSYRYPDKGFWLHSMAVGMMARALMEGAKDRCLGGEEAFVAGLLHDIGKLILDEFLDAEQGPREVALSEEQESAGFDHAELGLHILERWKIPGTIQEAVRHHHAPKQDDSYLPGACLLSIADQLCNHWGVGTRSLMDLGAEVEVEPFSEMLAALSFPEDKFLPLLWEMRQKLAVIENYYGDEA